MKVVEVHLRSHMQGQPLGLLAKSRLPVSKYVCRLHSYNKLDGCLRCSTLVCTRFILESIVRLLDRVICSKFGSSAAASADVHPSLSSSMHMPGDLESDEVHCT
jgi:hypothetical protein